MNPNMKPVVFWSVFVVVVASVLSSLVRTSPPRLPTVTYSQFLREVAEGSVASATINGGRNASPTVISLKDGRTEQTVLPGDYRLALSAMEAKLVNIKIVDSSENWRSILVNASPFLVLLALWVILMQRMQAKGKRGPAAPIV